MFLFCFVMTIYKKLELIMKQRIELKESQLKAMIAEAVRKTLNEGYHGVHTYTPESIENALLSIADELLDLWQTKKVDGNLIDPIRLKIIKVANLVNNMTVSDGMDWKPEKLKDIEDDFLTTPPGGERYYSR